MQWFSNFDSSVHRLIKSLKKGGSLVFSVPGQDSFPEWKSLCYAAEIPFTGNPLPSVVKLNELLSATGYAFEIEEEFVCTTYGSFIEWVRLLNQVGATTQVQNERLSTSQLLRLSRRADKLHPSGFPVTYHIIYVCLKKG